MNYMYRNERGAPFLLPFLAGAVVGPLFFNGFGAFNGNNHGCNGQGCFPYQGYQPYPSYINYNNYPAPVYYRNYPFI